MKCGRSVDPRPAPSDRPETTEHAEPGSRLHKRREVSKGRTGDVLHSTFGPVIDWMTRSGLCSSSAKVPVPQLPVLQPPPGTNSSCDYDPCLPPASDYDCAGGSGDGPEYTGRVKVTGSDSYGLDADGDGVGCE